MAGRSFRDRFLTPPVARAMTGPLGILSAGVGAAVGVLAFANPIVGGVVGAVALWAGRVAVAIPRDPAKERIDPFALREPWRHAVQDALQAQNRFTAAIADARTGPLRDRLIEIGERVADGVDEAWRVAKSGQALADARRHIDTAGAQRDLDAVQARAADPAATGGSMDKAVAALQAQLASAKRMERSISEAQDRLIVTNARLDEAVARAVELSVAAVSVSDLQGLGDDVEAMVNDLEALRLGLEEAGGASGQALPGTGTALGPGGE